MENLKIGNYSIDEVSKALGACAVGSYLLGYIIISSHFARLGFSQASPFRPRVLETGLTAALFFIIPFVIGAAASNISSRGLSRARAFNLRLPIVMMLC